MTNWALGAGINVVGGITINLGANLLRLGHTKALAAQEPRSDGSERSIRGRCLPRRPHPIWLLGLVLFLVGNILNFASFAFAAQSLLAALAVVQLVSNVVFARAINGERAGRGVLAATALVTVGCVLLVVFGSHESPVLDAPALTRLYSAAPYIAYLCALVTVSLFAGALLWWGGRRAPAAPAWLPVAFAVNAAGFGTQSVVYGKSLALLLRATTHHHSQLGHWYTWLALALFAGAAAFWVARYSEAMRRFPVSTMMPLLMILWVLFSMLSGMVYFQEYKTFTALSSGIFALGCCILLAGIFLFAVSQRSRQAQGFPALERQSNVRSSSGSLDSPLSGKGKLETSEDEEDGLAEAPLAPPAADPSEPADSAAWPAHAKLQARKPAPLLLLQTNPLADWEGRPRSAHSGSAQHQRPPTPGSGPTLPAVTGGFVNPVFGQARWTPMTCRPSLWKACPHGARGALDVEAGPAPPSGARSPILTGRTSSSPGSSVLSPIFAIFSMPGTLGPTTPSGRGPASTRPLDRLSRPRTTTSSEAEAEEGRSLDGPPLLVIPRDHESDAPRFSA